jgi:hypothetical protein
LKRAAVQIGPARLFNEVKNQSFELLSMVAESSSLCGILSIGWSQKNQRESRNRGQMGSLEKVYHFYLDFQKIRHIPNGIVKT